MTLTPMQEKAKKFCEALLEKYKGNEPFKGEDGEYHYIYLTILKHNHKFYIGKHSSKDYTIDPYTGSGKWYKNALKHHGIDAIENYPLCFFPTSDEAYAKEAEEVTLEMIENTFKRQIYNLQAGGKGGAKQSKEVKVRQAQAKRVGVGYIIKLGDNTEKVKRGCLITRLKEGWVIISHKSIQLYHPSVKDSQIKVKKEIGYMEEDILEADALGFVLGKAPKGHAPKGHADIDSKVKPFLLNRKERGRDRQGDFMREVFRYTLKLGDKTEDIPRYDILKFLKEGYRFTQETIRICHKEGRYKPHFFEKNGCKYNRESQHEKLIRLLESGLWQVGSKWEEPMEGLLQLEGLSPSILNGWAQGSYKVLIDKEGNEHEVFNTEVLGKLKEGYRFTQKGINICNKAGTVKPYLFEHPRMQATREERHLKLIGLLESGDWQMGMKWEEPVVAEIEEPVVAVKYDFVGLMSLIEGL